MPRTVRIQYENALYHEMARSNHGGRIFRDDTDRCRFVETLGEACLRSGAITFKQGSTTAMTMSKGYDNLNRLESVAMTSTAAGTQSYTYAHNSEGLRWKITQEDSRYWQFGYNDRGEVTSGAKKLPGDAAALGYQFGYSFDAIGNRLGATVNGRSATYTPNSVNEYVSRTVPGAVDVVGTALDDTTVLVNGTAASRQAGGGFYAEVAAGNASGPAYVSTLVSGSRAGNVATRSGHVFVPGTPESFGHDDDGNLISDGRWSYGWDGENRLISMETTSSAAAAGVPRQIITFQYDYQGRRISKSVKNWNGTAFAPHHTLLFAYDGWNLAAELLATGQKLRSYTWGADLSGGVAAGGVGGLLFVRDETTGKAYAPGYDGNVVRLYDMGDSGSLAATYEYGPFGELIVESGPAAGINPVRFSTKYEDSETDLLYYGLRYYQVAMGRWLSRDPVDENGGTNLYTFVWNTPKIKVGGSVEYESQLTVGAGEPEFKSLGKGQGGWKPYEVTFDISRTTNVDLKASAWFMSISIFDDSQTAWVDPVPKKHIEINCATGQIREASAK